METQAEAFKPISYSLELRALASYWAKESVLWNAGLDESQAGIKIAGRNINNLRYADDTTLMAESEEELKSLLLTVKKESDWFKTQHSKN